MKSINWMKIAGIIVAAIILLFSIKIIGEWREEQANNNMNEAENNDPEDNNMDKEDDDVKGIQSESVEVYVQDVCITPQTLQFMAANKELELIEMDEDSATIEVLNDEQRIILYEELSKMGEVKEVGDKTDKNQVKVSIISIIDKTKGN